MSHRVAPSSSNYRLHESSPLSGPDGGRAPESRTQSGFASSLRRVAAGIAADERVMEQALRRGGRGHLEPIGLISLQAKVYRHTQELELASKVVDKAAGAIKQTLQSQQ